MSGGFVVVEDHQRQRSVLVPADQAFSPAFSGSPGSSSSSSMRGFEADHDPFASPGRPATLARSDARRRARSDQQYPALDDTGLTQTVTEAPPAKPMPEVNGDWLTLERGLTDGSLLDASPIAPAAEGAQPSPVAKARHTAGRRKPAGDAAQSATPPGEPSLPAIPLIPQPHTGAATLAGARLQPIERDSTFAEPAFPVAQPPRRARGTANAVTTEQLNARALFAQAMATARRLHDTAVGDAQGAVARAEATIGRSMSANQSGLERGLQRLGAGLQRARDRVDSAASDTTLEVDRRETIAVVDIQRAARSAQARLTTAAGGAHGGLAGRRVKLKAAKDAADAAVASVVSASAAAVARIEKLDMEKEKEFPTGKGKLEGANNEVVQWQLPKNVTPSTKGYSEEAAAQQAHLGAKFTEAHKSASSQLDQLAVAIGKVATSSFDSMEKARTGGEAQARSIGARLRATIAQNRAAAHALLVRQHDASREQLIAAHQNRGQSDGRSAQQRAGREAAAAMAQAGAQKSGVRSAAETLARQSARPAADHARAVNATATSLLRNARSVVPDQRERVQRSGAAAETAATLQGNQTVQRLDRSASGMSDRFQEAAESSAGGLAQIVAEGAKGFDPLVEPIRDAGAATLKSARTSYAGQLANADKSVQSMTGARTSLMEGQGAAGGKKDAKTAPGAKARSGDESGPKEVPNKFIERAGKTRDDPKTNDPVVKYLIETTGSTVLTDVNGRATAINAQLKDSTSAEAVHDQMRDLTPARGAALSFQYFEKFQRSLEDHLKDELPKLMSTGGTDKANVAAALAYLAGNTKEGALQEMKAAVNWSNDKGRVAKAQRALSPVEMDELKKDRAAEVDEVIGDLDGIDKEVSGRLDQVSGKNAAARNLELLGEANAFALKGKIDDARKQRGEKGADDAGDQVGAFMSGIGDDKLSGGGMQVRATESDEDRKKRADALRLATKEGFAKVVTELPDGSKFDPKPGDDQNLGAIARYAAAPRNYQVFVPDDSEHGGHWETKTEGLDPRRANQIEQIVEKGADSEEAAAATIDVELNRTGKLREDKLRKALESNDVIAREGESDEERRNRLLGLDASGKKKSPGDLQKAIERRKNILKLVGQLDARNKDKVGDAGGAPTTDKSAGEVQTGILAKLDTKLAADPTARDYMKSMVTGLEPDPVKAFDFALAHKDKNKETLIAAAGRLNRDEIKDAVKKFDAQAATKGEKPFHQTFGLFKQGDGILEGDARNEVEIAMMGIPRNDREKAEVANMHTRQVLRNGDDQNRVIANVEFQALRKNQQELLDIMGVKASDIDEYGEIKKKHPDGTPITTSFDEKGRLVLKEGQNRDAFETALHFSKYNAESYNAAVDRATQGIVMALMIVAAVITTLVTFGGAAAIWGPILITAAAGLAGMALTAAIKGDRYTSDEKWRDFGMTIITAATAGLGAYLGAAFKPAAAAAKGLQGAEKVGEKLLLQGLTKGQRALRLGKEVVVDAGVGGVTNSINSAAGAALDPENRRKGIGAEKAAEGALHGFLSGGLGAAVMKPVGWAARGAGRYVNTRIGRPVKEPGGGLHWTDSDAPMTYGQRLSGQMASGFTSRLTDARFAAPGQSWTQSLQGAAQGSWQDILQATGDHGAEKLGRRYSDNKAGRKAAGERDQPTPMPTDAAGVPHPAGVAPEAMAHDAAVHHALPSDLAGIVDGVVPQRREQASADGAPAPSRAALELEPRRRGTSAEDEEFPHAIELPGSDKQSTVTAANDNGPGAHRVGLSDAVLGTMGRIAEGSVFIHPDSRNRVAANDNFGRLILADPTREVAVYRNAKSGEFLVIQGETAVVGKISVSGELVLPGVKETAQNWKGLLDQQGGNWVLEHHYHPIDQGPAGTSLIGRLASGAKKDFSIVVRQAQTFGMERLSSRIYFVDNGKLNFTDFGVDFKSSKPYFISFDNPVTGKRQEKSFKTLEDYHTFVSAETGQVYPLPHNFTEPIGPALRSGSDHTILTADDIAGVHAVATKLTAGNTVQGHAMLHQMGLIDEPNSTARLNLILNDTTLHIETRKQVASAVLDATRVKLAGQLGPGDDLQMLFHGATVDRAAVLREKGVKGEYDLRPGLDFSGGFYTTKHLEDAERYTKPWADSSAQAGPRGEIFAFVVRKSQLGKIVDIAPGGQHRAQWEAFVMANLDLYHEVTPYRPRPGDPPSSVPGFGMVDVHGNRGGAFEKFLETLGPHAQPDFVSGEAGGPGTTGAGRSEQQAVKSKVAADVLNEQIGFRPRAADNDDSETHAIRPTSDPTAADVENKPAGGAQSADQAQGPPARSAD